MIALVRASGSTELPARAQLVAAMNPFPCGAGKSKNRRCFCSPSEARRYVERVSGAVADRFGIHIELGNERKCDNNCDFDSFCDVLVDFKYKSEAFLKIIDKKRKISVEDQIKRISKLKFCKEKESFFDTFSNFKTILKNKCTFIENIHDIN